jgi:hypothetical protein
MPRSHPIGVATTYGLWLLVVDAGAELFYSSVAIVVLRSSVVVDGGTSYAMFLGGIYSVIVSSATDRAREQWQRRDNKPPMHAASAGVIVQAHWLWL